MAQKLPSIPSLQFYCPNGTSSELVSLAFNIAFDLGLEMTGSYDAFDVNGLGRSGNVMVVNFVILHDHTYETGTIPACEFSPGTVTNHCTTCGYTDKQTLAPVGGHSSEWYGDETGHRLTCIHCGETEQEGDHSFNQGVCDACGYEQPSSEPDTIPGDANGDGDVNNRDLALLQQYINGWGVTVDIAVADVNKDGDVNNRDLALLQQYINGWDVTLK